MRAPMIHISMGGDHSYLLSSQRETEGAGNDGSLNAPTGMPNRVEPVSRVQQTVTPQVGQKWWLIRVPALLVRVYILFGPLRWTVSFGKYALLVHGTPDRRWQPRQWHTLTTIGAAETMTLKAPHRHLAVLGIFVPPLTGGPIRFTPAQAQETSNSSTWIPRTELDLYQAASVQHSQH